MPRASKKNERPILVQGWDLSLNHSGFVELKNGELSRWWFVTDNPKSVRECPDHGMLLGMPKEMGKEEWGFHRLNWWATFFKQFFNALPSPHFVGVEDYAYADGMRAHQIGELGGQARLALYSSDNGFRLYDPHSIKMFASFNGAAQKPEIESAVRTRWGVDFSCANPPRGKPSAKHPEGKENRQTSEDLCDAFSIAKLVWTEYQLRNGLIEISDLHPKEIQVFNRTTKAYPVNLLGREWLERTEVPHVPEVVSGS